MAYSLTQFDMFLDTFENKMEACIENVAVFKINCNDWPEFISIWHSWELFVNTLELGLHEFYRFHKLTSLFSECKFSFGVTTLWRIFLVQDRLVLKLSQNTEEIYHVSSIIGSILKDHIVEFLIKRLGKQLGMSLSMLLNLFIFSSSSFLDLRIGQKGLWTDQGVVKRLWKIVTIILSLIAMSSNSWSICASLKYSWIPPPCFLNFSKILAFLS